MATPQAEKRDLSPTNQIATIFTTEIGSLLKARKTAILLGVQFLPVVIAVIYVFFSDVEGLSMFTETVEGVVFRFLAPLAALFYGGPALVDEMEGRTLTYLTLRPVPKPALFIGKWLAGATMAIALVVIPILALLIVAAIAAGGAPGTSATTVFQILGATIVGTATYTAIFAALGALFARSLLGGIVYFVVFEMVFAVLPVFELLSMRFHMRTAADFTAGDRLGALDQFILDEPLQLDWWMGLGLLGVVCAGAVLLGAYAFTNKQYHV
ncbi:MAG: ABC transporter permease [Persicimonas sp.]